jgi:hypothetical protein
VRAGGERAGGGGGGVAVACGGGAKGVLLRLRLRQAMLEPARLPGRRRDSIGAAA